MSLSSMTGFGSAQTDFTLGRLLIEIKSVNSRFFEMHPRMPDELRWAEHLVREILQRVIQRGKVELRVSIQQSESNLSSTQINPAGLSSALRLGHQIRQDHPEIAPFSVSELLRLPGVVHEPSISQDEWADLIRGTLTQALDAFTQSREREGARLAQVIDDRLQKIEALTASAKELIPQAIAAQKQRLQERLLDSLELKTDPAHDRLADQPQALSSPARPALSALAPEQLQALEDRIRQEVAVFGLRIDVAEELDRLTSHIHAARQALLQSSHGAGKRLDFLAQEMNREANTLGSKSPSTELSTVSIDIKLLIEQIREQAQNLE